MAANAMVESMSLQVVDFFMGTPKVDKRYNATAVMQFAHQPDAALK
jgi:hypothetical protein